MTARLLVYGANGYTGEMIARAAAAQGLAPVLAGRNAGAVGALARELAQGPTQAFGRAKLLFHQSTQESLETQMELEAQAIAASGHTEDFRNGVLAFARKQPVTFTGR